MKKRRSWIALAAVVAVLGGSYWQWQRLPRNELEVRGPVRASIDVLPRDRVLLRPIIDFKLPALGRVTLPKPLDAAPSDVSYLKANPAVGGLLRSHAFPAFKQAKWDIDGSLYPAGEQDIGGVDRIPVPFVFSDRAKRVRLFSSHRHGWSEVVLPANRAPAPRLRTISQEFGQLAVNLTPRPILTTLPYLEFAVAVEGVQPGRLLCLRFSKSDGEWNDDPFYLFSGKPLQLQIPVRLHAVHLTVAECSERSISIRIRSSKAGSFEGMSDGGMRMFDIEDVYLRVASGLGKGAIVFEGTSGRIDFGVEDGLIQISAWRSGRDYTFLKRLVGKGPLRAKIYTLGVASKRRLELQRLNPMMFIGEP